MLAGSRRLTFHEGGGRVSLHEVSERLGLEQHIVESTLADVSNRYMRELRLRSQPFMVADGGVAVMGIAGVISVGRDVELEVVPKCFDGSSDGWRDDFLVMAATTRLGRLLWRDRVSASVSEGGSDVLTLMAAAFLEEFERLFRIPIREYRRRAWTSIDLDGEMDYGEAWSVGPDGFRQGGLSLSTDNRYMAVICAAANYLGRSTQDRGVGSRLTRLASWFRATEDPHRAGRVPGRFASWQYLYDLAVAVGEGYGLRLGGDGNLRAPGFVLNTVQGWEDLLGLGFRSQGGTLAVRTQRRLTLGTRGQDGEPVVVRPDFVLEPPSLGRAFVVDAKYKNVEGDGRILAADLYEALACLDALGGTVAVLAYPGGDLSASGVEAGHVEVFDEVFLEARRVVGVRVSTDGIGKAGGFVRFGRRLGESLIEIAQG